MCARSIVASVWSELSQGSPGCRVGVIASCGPPASDYVPSEVPMQVTVPRFASIPRFVQCSLNSLLPEQDCLVFHLVYFAGKCREELVGRSPDTWR